MIYSFSMSKKTIPWEFIEQLLVEAHKTDRGLLVALDVEKSTYSNWKTRGAPLNQATAIAGYLGISTDYLLQKEGAIKEIRPASNSNDLGDAAELIGIFSRLSRVDRAEILGTARDLERIRSVQTGSIADDQS